MRARPRAGRVFHLWGSQAKGTAGLRVPCAPTQYHINKLSQSGEVDEPASTDQGLDDLDAALSNLEVKLEGSAPSDVLVRRGSSRGCGQAPSQGPAPL